MEEISFHITEQMQLLQLCESSAQCVVDEMMEREGRRADGNGSRDRVKLDERSESERLENLCEETGAIEYNRTSGIFFTNWCNPTQ